MKGKDRTQILRSEQIFRKIRRMAHEVMENNYEERDLVLVGIDGNGERMAKMLEAEIRAIAAFPIHLEKIILNKDKPLSEEIQYSGGHTSLKGKHVIIVDDVLNSGRTLIYAVRFILGLQPAVLRTAVLVDRYHRAFPVRADFVGLSLSTNLKEHVSVELAAGSEAVFLEA